MAIGRSLQFGLFGHAMANFAAYELGKHKPQGYLGWQTSSEQIKNRTKHVAIVELIAAGGALALAGPEAAILLTVFSLPLYSYAAGRYRANLDEEISGKRPTQRR